MKLSDVVALKPGQPDVLDVRVRTVITDDGGAWVTRVQTVLHNDSGEPVLDPKTEQPIKRMKMEMKVEEAQEAIHWLQNASIEELRGADLLDNPGATPDFD